jgi:mono/diheme cytochrome c family protein
MRFTALSLAVGVSLLAVTPITSPAADRATLDHGRKLLQLGGCNDCHTPAFMEKNGKVPQTEWFTGSPVGFQGPWGTTYASNLRLLAGTMTEAQWIARLRSEMRPPMPWFNLAAATDRDLTAMYHFIRSLGAKGEPAPSYAAPGVKVETPYIVMVPQNLPPAPAKK